MNVRGHISKYLKADDVAKPALFTIERVDEEEVGDSAKLVVYFTEVPNGIVLGPTTIAQIVDAVGSDETDDWVGHAIVAYKDPTVMFQGRKVGGIRFRAPKTPVKRKEIAVPQQRNGRSMHHDGGGTEDQDDLPF